MIDQTATGERAKGLAAAKMWDLRNEGFAGDWLMVSGCRGPEIDWEWTGNKEEMIAGTRGFLFNKLYFKTSSTREEEGLVIIILHLWIPTGWS